jgi:hypothetical protein
MGNYNILDLLIAVLHFFKSKLFIWIDYYLMELENNLLFIFLRSELFFFYRFENESVMVIKNYKTSPYVPML